MTVADVFGRSLNPVCHAPPPPLPCLTSLNSRRSAVTSSTSADRSTVSRLILSCSVRSAAMTALEFCDGAVDKSDVLLSNTLRKLPSYAWDFPRGDASTSSTVRLVCTCDARSGEPYCRCTSMSSLEPWNRVRIVVLAKDARAPVPGVATPPTDALPAVYMLASRLPWEYANDSMASLPWDVSRNSRPYACENVSPLLAPVLPPDAAAVEALLVVRTAVTLVVISERDAWEDEAWDGPSAWLMDVNSSSVRRALAPASRGVSSPGAAALLPAWSPRSTANSCSMRRSSSSMLPLPTAVDMSAQTVYQRLSAQAP